MIKKNLIKTLFLFCLLIILSAYGSSSNNNPVAAVQEQNVSDTDQKGEREMCLL